MPLFLVVTFRGEDKVGAEIRKLGPGNMYEIRPYAWVVQSDKTTSQLSKSFGIADGSLGAGIVAILGDHSGRGPSDLWEWINSRRGKNE